VVSAVPLAFNTSHNAEAAPTQTGSNSTAMISFTHFTTPDYSFLSRPQTSQNRKI
jgi:hypothetical protein